MIKQIDTYKVAGNGPETKLCLFMEVVGLGDHIHSLPVICSLLDKGYDLTVYARPFFRQLYESIGCTFKVPTKQTITLSFDADNIDVYGAIYKLNGWGIWKENELGYSPQDRIELFAELLGVEPPEKFDWLEVLNPEHREGDYIIFAPEASESWRSIPEARQKVLYAQLKNRYKNVVWLSAYTLFPSVQGRPGFSTENRTVAGSLSELIDLVANARAVISVESGTLALACALEVPNVGLYGMTEPTHIVDQFARYIPLTTIPVFGADVPVKDSPNCNRPCYRQPMLKSGRCCGTSHGSLDGYDYPYCMAHLSFDKVLESLEQLTKE